MGRENFLTSLMTANNLTPANNLMTVNNPMTANEASCNVKQTISS